MLLVFAFGFTDGGYYGETWTALTATLAAVVAISMLVEPRIRLSRLGVATLALFTCLAAWTVLSLLWAVPGALDRIEGRRVLLYLVALAAVLTVVERRARRPFLVGLVAGLTTLGVVGLVLRAANPRPLDPFYGSLLEEPVGYPNALGILATLGVLLAIGLGVEARSRFELRATRAAGAMLVLVLGLTGSRGAALALILGLCVAPLLAPRRRQLIGETLGVVSVGMAAWVAAEALGAASIGSLVGLVLALGAVVVLPARLLAPRRRVVVGLVVGAVAAAALTIAVVQPSTSSSFRTAYWSAALDGAREHSLLGSGAGSFRMTWLEYRQVETEVRDAHSLYIEALSELGPVGLVLVLGFVGLPIVAAVRRRHEPLVPLAGAAFVAAVAHAGIDWDWEMPVVMLVVLGTAGAVLAGSVSSTFREVDDASARQRTGLWS